MGGEFLPQFQSQLQHMETQSSSLASKSLVYSVSILNDYGIYLLSGLIGSLFVGFLLYRFLEKFQEFVDQIFFKIPFLGFFKRKVLFNKFTKTLGLLLNARIDLLSSLEKAINGVPNKALQKELHKIQNDVRTGLKLSQSLQKHNSESNRL
jgi:type II secretory pathway component PulF